MYRLLKNPAQCISAFLAVLMAVPLHAQAASAAERFGPSGGDSEVQVSGSISKTDTDGGDFKTTTAQFGFGYYLKDPKTGGSKIILNGEAEVGGQLFWLKSDGFDSISVLPYGRLNYRINERTATYGGVHIGIQKNKVGGQSSDGTSYGFHGGLKNWLSPELAGFLEGRWTKSKLDDFDTTEIIILVGLSYTL
jgi:hypothetical protein